MFKQENNEPQKIFTSLELRELTDATIEEIKYNCDIEVVMSILEQMAHDGESSVIFQFLNRSVVDEILNLGFVCKPCNEGWEVKW